MDARRLTEFFQHKSVKWVVLVFSGLILVTVIGREFIAKDQSPKPKTGAVSSKDSSPFAAKFEDSKVDYNFLNQFEDKEKTPPVKAPVGKKEPTGRYTPQPPKYVTPKRNDEVPPIINIYTRALTSTEMDKDVSNRFAPCGRIMECELVMTIDSAATDTPIIALVTKDLYHAGKLIIPAGAEVHGKARNQPVRDRIFTESEWVVVWRTKSDDNGKELRIKGIALTKEAMLAEGSWHLYDGSAGIRGEVIKSDEMTELIAYAAQFVASFTGAMVPQSTTTTAWGQTIQSGSNTSDAINEGISAAVQKYADKLLDEIQRTGYFVRCAGGTEFYLYIQETIDHDEAEIANTRVKKNR